MRPDESDEYLVSRLMQLLPSVKSQQCHCCQGNRIGSGETLTKSFSDNRVSRPSLERKDSSDASDQGASTVERSLSRSSCSNVCDNCFGSSASLFRQGPEDHYDEYVHSFISSHSSQSLADSGWDFYTAFDEVYNDGITGRESEPVDRRKRSSKAARKQSQRGSWPTLHSWSNPASEGLTCKEEFRPRKMKTENSTVSCSDEFICFALQSNTMIKTDRLFSEYWMASWKSVSCFLTKNLLFLFDKCDLKPISTEWSSRFALTAVVATCCLLYMGNLISRKESRGLS